MTETQPSRLLPALFENVDPGSLLTVLNLGPALPESVAFFSDYRCRLHIADLFPELPFSVVQEDESDIGEILGQRLDEALCLPGDIRFDMIFFWDVLNFMSAEAITVLTEKLKPHLHARTRAHCFAVHSSQTPAAMESYGIADHQHLSVRHRSQVPPDYQPHPQGKLLTLLRYFAVDSSVLMRDRRIELLLKAQL